MNGSCHDWPFWAGRRVRGCRCARRRNTKRRFRRNKMRRSCAAIFFLCVIFVVFLVQHIQLTALSFLLPFIPLSLPRLLKPLQAASVEFPMTEPVTIAPARAFDVEKTDPTVRHAFQRLAEDEGFIAKQTLRDQVLYAQALFDEEFPRLRISYAEIGRFFDNLNDAVVGISSGVGTTSIRRKVASQRSPRMS